MEYIRTPKGTASDKSTALTLTLASVLLKRLGFLVVGLAFDAGAGTPKTNQDDDWT